MGAGGPRFKSARPDQLHPKFALFIRERRYLANVSERTIQWYEESFNWLLIPCPSEIELGEFVIRMRQAGLKPSSCNNRIRAVNAFLKWSGSELRVSKVKEEQRVLPTFTKGDIDKLVRFKAKGRTPLRLQVLVLTLIDTGCRISEAIALRWDEIDFDNLLILYHGKGRKERRVPFSFELRRRLYALKQKAKFDLVFCTRDGNSLNRRVVLRDVKLLCKRVGIVAPERTLHAFRHTFALTYLRNGGSVFHLQKILGHTSLDQTRKYVNLLTDDLSAVHQKLSPLGRL